MPLRRFLCTFLSGLLFVETHATAPDSIPQSTGCFGHSWYGFVPYGKSLLADVHPNFARADICNATNHNTYDYGNSGKNNRFFFQGVFGFDLPIWHADFCNNRFGLNISDVMSATVWMDFFDKTTAPVVNTDFRAGAPTVAFIHRLDNQKPRRFLYNYSLSVSPFKHESSHIGDEQQIRRIDSKYALRRVNVSYNYCELALTLNEPENTHQIYHTFRIGGMFLLSPQASWYSVIEEAGDGSSVYVHKRVSPWEAYLQYQFQSPATRLGLQAVASYELRNRVKYGYDLSLVEGEFDNPMPDSRSFSHNVFVGLRVHSRRYRGYFSTKSFGIRYYHGICPYGMFRSIAGYSSIGISVIVQ